MSDPTQPRPLRSFIVPGLFVIALFAAVLLRDPPAQPSSHIGGQAFGTTFSVRWIATAEEHGKTAVKLATTQDINEVNASMSTYHPQSELSIFNSSTSTKARKLSAELSKVLAEAKTIHQETGGAFDVTVGPLVNAWGFGPETVVEAPSKEKLQKAFEKVGFAKFLLDVKAQTGQKQHPQLYVDLSAIAKGFGVDLVGEKLEALGIENYLVEIGGEVRARGQGTRGTWTVGVEAPQSKKQQTIFETLALDNASMATSGNYRNFAMVDGKKVTHIIDPRNGQPVAHGLGSVSVVHKNCMRADALATSLYVLGAEEGFKLAEKQGWAALFLTREGEKVSRRATSAFEALKTPKKQ